MRLSYNIFRSGNVHPIYRGLRSHAVCVVPSEAARVALTLHTRPVLARGGSPEQPRGRAVPELVRPPVANGSMSCGLRSAVCLQPSE